MKVCSASLRVLPELPICFQALDRPRVGIVIVEVANLYCDTQQCRIVFRLRNHLELDDISNIQMSRPSPALLKHKKNYVIRFFFNISGRGCLTCRFFC